jgi:tetratricopeptide (TPR) repeat protein
MSCSGLRRKKPLNHCLPFAKMRSSFSHQSFMNLSLLLALFTILTPIVAQAADTPAVQEPAKQPKELLPNQQEFLKLSGESRKEFFKHFSEATRLFQQKRIFESLDEIDKAEKIFSDSPEIFNLRGSCFVEMRAFDKALVEFKKSAAIDKNNGSIEFNIGEVYFCTKEWQKAYDQFQRVLKLLPVDNIALGRLVEFKILLCDIQLGKINDATILSEKYDFLDDSPFYYYAKAAMAYQAKNSIKAEEWLQIASRIFQDPNVLAPWQDTLVEYGYMKSFYGNDTSAAVDK